MSDQTEKIIFHIVLVCFLLFVFLLLAVGVYIFTDSRSTAILLFTICSCTLILAYRQQKIMDLLSHKQEDTEEKSDKN